MTTGLLLKRVGAYSSIALAASGATLLAVRARAAGIPDADVMTYTGYLEDPSGAPLAGKHSISVRFWASDAATKALCTGELADAELVSGRFQVPLPDDCTAAVKASPDTFVDVLVDGASLGRTKLGAVPYAVEAGHATNAEDAAHAAIASDADGALKDRIAALEGSGPLKSAFLALNTTGPDIPSNTEPVVLFDSESFDTAKEYEPATGTFTTKAGGYYDIACNLIFDNRTAATPTYYLEAGIFINNVRKDVAAGRGDGYTQAYRARNVFKLAAGDKVTCRGYQNGAATMGLIPARAGEAVSSFSALFVAP